MNLRRGDPGYSLMEAMVAFAVMTAMLAVLIPTATRLRGRASDADLAFLATEVALSELAAVGVTEPLEIGVTVSTTGPWRTELEVAVADGDVVEELELRVRVFRNGRELVRLVEVRVAPLELDRPDFDPDLGPIP